MPLTPMHYTAVRTALEKNLRLINERSVQVTITISKCYPRCLITRDPLFKFGTLSYLWNS